MPDQWKESIIVPIHKTGDKTDCNNYREISLLSTSYKILSNGNDSLRMASSEILRRVALVRTDVSEEISS
jgi:hypothetical protein